MRERDKKTQNCNKKKTLSFTSQLHPATAALPGCPHDQSPSQRCLIWHLAIDVAPVWSQLTEKNVKFFLPLPHFPRQISISHHLRQGKVLHDCSFCMQPKGKGKTKTTLCVTNRANTRLRKTMHFVFFLMCFFFLSWEKSMSACNEKKKKKHAVA